MTLILGLEDPQNTRAIVCADSGAWRHDEVDTLRTPKLWRDNGWIAGLAGRWAHSCAIRHELRMPEVPDGASREETERLLYRYARDVNKLSAELEEECRRSDPQIDGDSPNLVVARGMWVWYIFNGSVIQTRSGFVCAGMTMYANGAIAVARDVECEPLRQAERVMLAVRDITRNIQPPFIWWGTDGSEGYFE